MHRDRDRDQRRPRIGRTVGGIVLLALVAGIGTGGLRPSRFAEQLAGIVDGEQLGRVARAAGDGDVALTTDELAALAGSVVAGAAAVAEDVVAAAADEIPRPTGAPPLCPLPDLGSSATTSGCWCWTGC